MDCCVSMRTLDPPQGLYKAGCGSGHLQYLCSYGEIRGRENRILGPPSLASHFAKQEVLSQEQGLSKLRHLKFFSDFHKYTQTLTHGNTYIHIIIHYFKKVAPLLKCGFVMVV